MMNFVSKKDCYEPSLYIQPHKEEEEKSELEELKEKEHLILARKLAKNNCANFKFSSMDCAGCSYRDDELRSFLPCYKSLTDMGCITKKQDSAPETHDAVNHPSHYAKGGIECIKAIEASMTPKEFQAYCKGNVMKYVWRWDNKGGIEDLKKAEVYLGWMIESVDKEIENIGKS